MSKLNIIRAWKDPEYRASLTADELASLPDSPAGMIDLSSLEQQATDGGGASGLPIPHTVFSRCTSNCGILSTMKPTQILGCGNSIVGPTRGLAAF